MSFIEVPGPHYIKRTLIFVDSEDRDPNSSTDNYLFRYNLDQELQQVFSLELVQYIVPRAVNACFLGSSDLYFFYRTGVLIQLPQNSNMVYDVLFQNADKSASLAVEGNLDPGFFFFVQIPWGGVPLDNQSLFLAVVNDLAIRYLLFAGIDPVFSQYDLSGSIDGNFRITWWLENTNVVPTVYGFVNFLFATGPNRINQASIPLGYEPNTDVSGDATLPRNELIAPYMLNNHQFVYLDIFLAQAREFEPWARIYTVDESDGSFNRCLTLPHRTRILQQPVRNLRELDFDIRVSRGLRLYEFTNINMSFTIEALSIAQVPKVPEWVKQRLSL